jgi:hypothetical protein
MNTRRTRQIGNERGSALVIAVLVIVILTLLGVSFLLMAETENKIAENERLSAQALYFAEAGARIVKMWFDRPMNTGNVRNPTPVNSVIDRTQRKVDDDGDPSTAPHPQDGSTWPRYKQGVDINGDSIDDVFEKPYRGGATLSLRLRNTLLGTEDGPDMRIDEGVSAAKTFLQDLSNALLTNYPMGGGVTRARIIRIDVYGPPYVNVSGSWTRYGMGTIKVVARIYKIQSGVEQVLAERMIKAVLNETPYPGPFGPLHSCDVLDFNGEFAAHWGVVTAVSSGNVPNNFMNKMWSSIPRDIPGSQRIDRFYGWGVAGKFEQLKANLEAANAPLKDPWFRFLDAMQVDDWPTSSGFGSPQVYPPAASPVPSAEDQSNLFQNLPLVTCPEFDYWTWKTIATTPGSNVHYFTWDNGSSFKENGSGTALPFQTWTDYTAAGREGLYFFDTTNGDEPKDTTGDGFPDNLTPEIKIQGTNYGARGFLYLNTVRFTSNGTPGRPIQFHLPAEPFQDLNEDGVRDPSEPYINLNYNNITSLTSNITASATDDYGNAGGGPTYNISGPTITADAMLWGVLYNNGYFDSQGTPRTFGSIITKGGAPASAGTVDVYWDDTIGRDWPPPGWDLPRVIITRWETDL